MTAPRRPGQGRADGRRSPSRTGSSRAGSPRPGGPRSSSARTRPSTSRTTAPVAGSQERGARAGTGPRRQGLTGRAAVLVLVLAALVVSAALPLRELLAQRGEISELRADQTQAQERVDALEAEKLRLGDPAYVAAEARRRLHFVLPGETSYVLILPTPEPGEQEAEAGPGAEAPWYSQVWSSVQAADAEPAPAPTP